MGVANVNDTIFLSRGITNETLVITKPVKLKGVSVDKTRFMSTNGSKPIICINASFVVIENISFSFTEKIKETPAIDVKTSYNTLNNLKISNSFYAIYLDSYSDHNHIKYSDFIDNMIAVYSNYAHSNIIEHNSFLNNSNYGCYIASHSQNSEIMNNTFSENNMGLRIKSSESNRIYQNIFKDNQKGLVICCNAKNNLIYANIFLDNAKHAEDPIGNQWYYQHTGNYWDDYTSFDDNDDGRGDIPYPIPASYGKSIVSDHYPLLQHKYR